MGREFKNSIFIPRGEAPGVRSRHGRPRAYLLVSTERINLTYNTGGGARAPS